MNNDAINILIKEIETLESFYNRKKELQEKYIKEFREWAAEATEYEIATFTGRQNDISNNRTELIKRREEIDRLKWLLSEMTKENNE